MQIASLFTKPWEIKKSGMLDGMYILN